MRFADADLTGIPYRVTLGRGLERGEVELRSRESGEVVTLPLHEVVSHLAAWLRSEAGAVPLARQ